MTFQKVLFVTAVLCCTFSNVDATTLNVPSTYSTIQSAINAASNGDTVLAAPGTYYENLTIISKHIVLMSLGDGSLAVIRPANQSALVLQIAGVGTGTTIVDGFTFVDGGENGTLLLDNGSTNLIRNCIFHHNDPSWHNGPEIIRCYSGTPIIERSLFHENGGISCIGIWSGTQSSRIVNNTFSHNARGFFNFSNSTIAQNNIVSGSEEYGIYGEYSVLSYNDVYTNYPNYAGLAIPGVGSISIDPSFVNKDAYDFQLREISPCIDAGDPDPQFNDPNGTRNDMGAFAFNLCAVRILPQIAVVPSAISPNIIPNLLPSFYWHYVNPNLLPQIAYECEMGTDADWQIAELWSTGTVYTADTFAVYGGSTLQDGNTVVMRIRAFDGIEWSCWRQTMFTVLIQDTLDVPMEYATIQAAYNAATVGDLIRVSSGTYVENLTFSNKSVSLESVSGAASTFITPIDPQIATILISNLQFTSLVRGFTFTGGGSVNNIVLDRSNVNFLNNICRLNNPVWGSSNSVVISCSGGSQLIEGNIFYQNGGISCVGAYSNAKDVRIINNTFFENARGFFTLSGIGVVALNNIVAKSQGYAAYGNFDILDYCDFWQNGSIEANVGSYSIYVDPLFSDPTSMDFSLSPGSPCIDAGMPDPQYNDPDGTRNDMGAVPVTNNPNELLANGFTIAGEQWDHVTDNTPHFSWSYDQYRGPQLQYECEIGSDADWSAAEMLSTGEISSYDTTFEYLGVPLIRGATYYARLRLANASGWGRWSHFMFRMNSIPPLPARLYPIENAVVPTNKVFIYLGPAVDAESDVLVSDVQVSADEMFSTIETEFNSVPLSATNSMRAGHAIGLSAGGNYWWRVRSYDGFEFSTWSAPISFQVSQESQGNFVPGDFPTISAAVSGAADNDSIYLLPGTYVEQIVVNNKRLHIRSLSDSSQAHLRAEYGITMITFLGAGCSGGSIEGCVFENGTSIGIRIAGGAAITVHHNVFQNNGGNWAVVLVESGASTILRNVFVYNQGGGASVRLSPNAIGTRVENNTFYFNGHGVVSDLTGIVNGVIVRNNIFARNSGVVLYDIGSGADYNLFWQSNSPYNSGTPSGVHDMFSDPLFVNEATYDFHLLDGSPCIDAGDPATAALDPDGTIADLGAFYVDHDPNTSPPRVRYLGIPGQNVSRVIGLSPTITWTYSHAYYGQTMYRAEVGRDADWSIAEVWKSGEIVSSDASCTYAGPELTDGLTYYIRVSAFNGVLWSNWESLVFKLNSNPTRPTAISPRDTVVRSINYNLLVSNATDLDRDALRYQYEIYGDSNLSQVLHASPIVAETPSATSYSPGTDLGDNRILWWRARAWDGFEYSLWSTPVLFAIDEINDPPYFPIILSPPNGADSIVTNMLPTFDWMPSSDPDPLDTVRYIIQVSTNENFSFLSSTPGIERPPYSLVDSLLFGTRYWWRVIAYDRSGQQTNSLTTKSFWTWKLGDMNNSHSINVTDLTMLASYLFGHGPAPTQYLIADINGDCRVSILDLLHLVDFLFKGGREPQIGCAYNQPQTSTNMKIKGAK